MRALNDPARLDPAGVAPAPSADEQRLRQRHAEVLGDGPRIAPLDREAVADSVRAAAARLIGATGRAPSAIPLELLPEIMFTMCRVPGLWDSLIGVTVELQGASAVLPPRERKLAILRTTWLCQTPYVFGEHVKQAKRLGFTRDEIERIVAGSSAPGWEPHERAVLAACEELRDRAMVSDPTWQQLAERFDEAQLIELLVLIGQFTATAYFQNGLRLRLEQGSEGLLAR